MQETAMRWMQTVLTGLLFAVVGVAAPADKKPPTDEQLADWYDNLVGVTNGGPADWTERVGWEKHDYVLHGVFGFIDHPNEAVPFLRKKLKPADGPQAKAIDGWVKDFLGDDPKSRDAADEELRKHREDFVVLQKLLDAGRATDSQPLRRRVVAVVQNEKVTELKEGEGEPLPIEFRPAVWIDIRRQLNSGKRSGPPQARYFAEGASDYAPFRNELPRTRRALLVLERIGTPEAVEVLKEVAGGREGLPATAAAKEAVARLKAK